MKRIVTNDHQVIYFSDDSMYYLKARVSSVAQKTHYMLFNSLTDNFLGELSEDNFYQLVGNEVWESVLCGWRIDDKKVLNESNA